MFVSCLCPTYGRCPDQQWLLEEAIESFLRQDYPADKRELIILNDCAAQTLACDAPGVRVVNWPARFNSLGAKYNALAALARGTLLAPWEDDDLSLSHRLTQAVERLGAANYWKPRALWYWQAGEAPRRDHGGVCHNASIYRKDAWLRVGGYPAVSGRQDAEFDAALHRLGAPAPPLAPDDCPAYVYRWGVSEMHLSGQTDCEQAYRERGSRSMDGGTFHLHPHWREDYGVKIDAGSADS